MAAAQSCGKDVKDLASAVSLELTTPHRSRITPNDARQI